MPDLLGGVNSPDDIKKIKPGSLSGLCAEIREFLTKRVLENGGHLSSNLGVVELTVALHRVFNVPEDKIIWDVGHQAYVHKIICGRRDSFDSLRKLGGISGFPKTSESEYDSFDTGHSSTSMSAALGIAAANDLNCEKGQVVAVIGDASFMGGPALEALNHIIQTNKKVIIVLNDNQMSIGRAIGGFARYFHRIHTRSSYYTFKRETREILEKVPLIGKPFTRLIRDFKAGIKFFISPGVVFEKLGYKYLGPIDGHDIKMLCDAFEEAKTVDRPVIVHVSTVKGKGYPPAELNPSKYHAVSCSNSEAETFSSVFGRELARLAAENSNIVSVCPSTPSTCCLYEFALKYRDRFFDTGIAEGHAVTFAAGLARGGKIPVVSVYSSFLQRAYDSIVHDVCIGNYHVVFAIDRAGLVGDDGETHQGVFDLSYLSSIPNMSILAPSDFSELAQMLDFAVNRFNSPIAIRYPKGSAETIDHAGFVFGKAEVVREGKNVTVAAVGTMLKTALDAAELLEKKGISAEVINLRTVKPIDFETVFSSAEKTGRLFVIEDNLEKGGIGSVICTEACRQGFAYPIVLKAFPDTFIRHGTISQLMKMYRMDYFSLAADIERSINLENKA